MTLSNSYWATTFKDKRYEQMLREVPSAPPMYAVGESLRHSAKQIGSNITEAGFAVRDIASIATGKYDYRTADPETERIQKLQESTSEIAGAMATPAKVVFAGVGAVFEGLNAMDEKKKSVLSPFLAAMNISMEAIMETMTMPEDSEERDMRMESVIGNWAAKVREGAIWLGAEAVSLIPGVDVDPAYTIEDMDSYAMQMITKNILNETLPDLAMLVAFEAGGKGLKKGAKEGLSKGLEKGLEDGFKSGVKEGIKTGTKVAVKETAKTALGIEALKGYGESIRVNSTKFKEAFGKYTEGMSTKTKSAKFLEAVKKSEWKDTPEQKKKLAELDKAIEAKDTVAIEEIAFSEIGVFNKYIKTKGLAETVAKQYKGLLGKMANKTVPTFAERRSFVKSFEKAFSGASKNQGLNNLIADIKKSPTKAELFPDVMSELTTSSLAHPKAMEYFGFDGSFGEKRMPGLKGDKAAKEMKSVEGKKVDLPKVSLDTPSAKEFNKYSKMSNIEFKKLDDMKLIRDKTTGDVVGVKGRGTGPQLFKKEGAAEYMESAMDATERVRKQESLTKEVEEFAKEPLSKEAIVEKAPVISKLDYQKATTGKRLSKDKDVGFIFKEDSSPLTWRDHVVEGKRIPVIEKIIKSEKLKKDIVRNSQEVVKEEWNINTKHLEIEAELLSDFKPEVKSGVEGMIEKVSRAQEAARIEKIGREMWDAITSEKLDKLEPSQRKVAEKIVTRLDELRTKLSDKHVDIIKKYKKYNKAISKEINKITDNWLEPKRELLKEIEAKHRGEGSSGVDTGLARAGVLKQEIKVVEGVINGMYDLIESRKKLVKESDSIIKRLSKENKAYLPQIVDPIIRQFLREHMPDVYKKIESGMTTMDNPFLKQKVDFPFFKKNAIEAYSIYEKYAAEQMNMLDTVADMYQDAALQGYVKGTTKYKFLDDFVEQKIKGNIPGKEAVVPTLKPVYDFVYKTGKWADSKFGTEAFSKLTETTRVLDGAQLQYLKKYAKDFGSLKLSDVGNGQKALTMRTFEPTANSMHNALTGVKMLGYSGTIGMNPRTSMLNLITQPLVGFAHSGLGMKELYSAYKEGFALLRDKDIIREMEASGMAPTQRQLLNPEGGVGAQAKSVAGKGVEFMLSNMRYTELVARYVVGRIGAIAFEKGKLPKSEVGELVNIGGKKVSRKYSDRWNYEYGSDMAPGWVDATVGGMPVGRAVYYLSSFGQKTLAEYWRTAEKAEFGKWMEGSKKTLENKQLNTQQKLDDIYKDYKSNYSRLGIAKQTAYGLAAAMVMGQIFDIDMDEFLTKGIGFGLSNPVTNLFLGAGGYNDTFGSNLKPFIPGRGAIRTIDKTLGLDILSDYQDYGNVPQIEDLLLPEE